MEPICTSISDTGKLLGIGRTTVYELINAGKLETVTLGRRRLVRFTSIKALVGQD